MAHSTMEHVGLRTDLARACCYVSSMSCTYCLTAIMSLTVLVLHTASGADMQNFPLDFGQPTHPEDMGQAQPRGSKGTYELIHSSAL